jgi:hypothetical protein
MNLLGALLVIVGQTPVEPLPTRVGPFFIKSTTTAEGSPYPVTHKITQLTWSSTDKSLIYNLTDDGEKLKFQFNVTPFCVLSSNLLPLTAKSDRLFSEQLAASCLSRFRADIDDSVIAELQLAVRHFPDARAEFQRETMRLHGPSQRRCKKTDFGYHGPICVKYDRNES